MKTIFNDEAFQSLLHFEITVQWYLHLHCCVLARKSLLLPGSLGVIWQERERYEKRAGAINPNALPTISSAHIFSFSLEE